MHELWKSHFLSGHAGSGGVQDRCGRCLAVGFDVPMLIELYHPRCSTCPGRSPKGNSQRVVFMWRDAWNLPSEWCSARFPGRLGYQYSSHKQTDNNRGSQTLSTYPKSLPTRVLSCFSTFCQDSGNFWSTAFASDIMAAITGSKVAPLPTFPSAHHVLSPMKRHFGIVCQVLVPSIQCEKFANSRFSLFNLFLRRLPLNQNGVRCWLTWRIWTLQIVRFEGAVAAEASMLPKTPA